MAKYHNKFSKLPYLTPQTKVVKVSGKPFKHGGKISTIKDIVEHPYLPQQKAYSFYEDDSLVRTSYVKKYIKECF